MLLAKEMGAKSLLVKNDSLLIKGQVTGEYQTKDPHMAAYLLYVKILKEAFVVFELVRVPREKNAENLEDTSNHHRLHSRSPAGNHLRG